MTVRANRRPRYKFRLYVASGTVNSMQALSNLHALCSVHLAGVHDIEIVDVLKDPMRALDDGVLMTPTLVRISPNPVRRIVGTLGHSDTVLQALGLASPSA
jgi:circadian clock protein KaiB